MYTVTDNWQMAWHWYPPPILPDPLSPVFTYYQHHNYNNLISHIDPHSAKLVYLNSTGIQQNQNHQKNRSFNFWSQSNFEFGYRTKWSKVKLSNSELLIASMLIYWSSVKAVKAILILVSFIISIFGVNSKINILRENVNAFVYQGKMF